MIIRPFNMVDSVLKAEPGRWNVISVCKHFPRKSFCSHHCHLNFDDVNLANLQDGRIRQQIAAGWICPPKHQHIEMALRFARKYGSDHLLVHCREGVSRSPAIAWCILLDEFGSAEKATDALFAIHPQCRPNDLIIQIGLETINVTAVDLNEVLAGMAKLFVFPENDQSVD